MFHGKQTLRSYPVPVQSPLLLLPRYQHCTHDVRDISKATHFVGPPRTRNRRKHLRLSPSLYRDNNILRP